MAKKTISLTITERAVILRGLIAVKKQHLARAVICIEDLDELIREIQHCEKIRIFC